MLLHDSSELLDGHLYTAVTYKEAYRTGRIRDSCADRGRDSETHCPQASGRDETAGTLEVGVSRCHQLVLPDIGHHDRLASAI